jgi:hypothetical protein
MRAQRLAVTLTVINLMLLVVLVAQQVQPAIAVEATRPGGEVAQVLRARALEIVDEENRVRAMLAVMPPSTVDGKQYPETVLLRLIDPKNGPLVKLTAAEDGGSLGLYDPSDFGVTIHARDDGSFVKVSDKTGREEVIRP